MLTAVERRGSSCLGTPVCKIINQFVCKCQSAYYMLPTRLCSVNASSLFRRFQSTVSFFKNTIYFISYVSAVWLYPALGCLHLHVRQKTEELQLIQPLQNMSLRQ